MLSHSHFIHHLKKAEIISVRSEFNEKSFVGGKTRDPQDLIITTVEVMVLGVKFEKTWHRNQFMSLESSRSSSRQEFRFKTLYAMNSGLKSLMKVKNHDAMEEWTDRVEKAVLQSRSEFMESNSESVGSTFKQLVSKYEANMLELEKSQFKNLIVNAGTFKFLETKDVLDVWNEILAEQILKS